MPRELSDYAELTLQRAGIVIGGAIGAAAGNALVPVIAGTTVLPAAAIATAALPFVVVGAMIGYWAADFAIEGIEQWAEDRVNDQVEQYQTEYDAGVDQLDAGLGDYGRDEGNPQDDGDHQEDGNNGEAEEAYNGGQEYDPLDGLQSQWDEVGEAFEDELGDYGMNEGGPQDAPENEEDDNSGQESDLLDGLQSQWDEVGEALEAELGGNGMNEGNLQDNGGNQEDYNVREEYDPLDQVQSDSDVGVGHTDVGLGGPGINQVDLQYFGDVQDAYNGAEAWSSGGEEYAGDDGSGSGESPEDSPPPAG